MTFYFVSACLALCVLTNTPLHLLLQKLLLGLYGRWVQVETDTSQNGVNASTTATCINTTKSTTTTTT